MHPTMIMAVAREIEQERRRGRDEVQLRSLARLCRPIRGSEDSK